MDREECWVCNSCYCNNHKIPEKCFRYWIFDNPEIHRQVLGEKYYVYVRRYAQWLREEQDEAFTSILRLQSKLDELDKLARPNNEDAS